MEQAFNLRYVDDLVALADHLPTIDQNNFALSKVDFVNALRTLDVLPAAIDLRYQWGTCDIFRSAVGLPALVDLGRHLQRLRESDGFDDFVSCFGNASQFWDSYFEARVGSYFAGLASVHVIAIGAAHVVRGRTKRPDFTLTTDVGAVVVECKRIHFNLSRTAATFSRDAKTIDAAIRQEPALSVFRIELDVMAPARERIETFAPRVVREATQLATAGGGDLVLDHALLYVRPRDHGRVIDLDSPGQHHIEIITPGGKAIRVVDHEYCYFHARNARIDVAFRRLLDGAIKEARKQLPEYAAGVICVGDVSERFAEQTFVTHVQRLVLPDHIGMIVLWNGDLLRPFVPENRLEFAEAFLQTTFPRDPSA